MNEILKKRIEEAANDRYTDNTFAYKGFIDGAEYALSHQWISVKDRMPSEWQSVFILLIEKNDIKVTEAIYLGEMEYGCMVIRRFLTIKISSHGCRYLLLI